VSARPIKLAVIIGTRPEAIKLAPVVLAARARPAEFRVQVIRTGQHRELVDQLLHEFDIEADADLRVMQPSQDLAHMMAKSVRGLSMRFAQHRPDWVIVQGDTTTAFAGALAAFYNRIRVGHVEAGLRTGKRHSPYPEEVNRAMISRVADLHFAPTAQARANLLREGIADAEIVVTGNTVVDVLHAALARAPEPPPGPPPGRYLLVTVHRRENHGAPLAGICDGILGLLAGDPLLEAWVPMHPSPQVRRMLIERLGREPRVRLTEPFGYTRFVQVLSRAALVLTDSGGIQEECATLGKPVLVLRRDTERPEAVDAGVALLVGTAAQRIIDVASALLADRRYYDSMARPSTAFGEGAASALILDALALEG
jgi:UDP-N-acetylglucosamine 2-epimerase (non-hydrolysing)